MGLPIIIIELGINHNGDLDTARKMIYESLQAMYNGGYDISLVYWKLQKRTPEISVPDHMKNTPRKSLLTGEMTTYFQYKKEIEFGRDEYVDLMRYTSALTGLDGRLFASVWDNESVDFMAELNKYSHWPGIPFLKIPSAHLTNLDLIRHAEKTSIPMIVSTGMSTRIEVFNAMEILHFRTDSAVMACTATYPCPDEEVNLRKISTLRRFYGSNAKIGFSSHSPSPYPAIYSNFFNVDMIEVHFTLDRAMKGSDHAASLEAPALELLARETKRIPKLYGHGQIAPYESEMGKRKSLRGN